jgi:hypothetical protein
MYKKLKVLIWLNLPKFFFIIWTYLKQTPTKEKKTNKRNKIEDMHTYT